MSWTLGKITIPQAPHKVAKKTIATLKKIPYLVAYPWVMSMGADATELQIEGEIMGDINETLYTTYLDKLETYTRQNMVIDEVLLDDSVDSGTWTGSATTTFKNTGSQAVKFENSVFVDWASGYIYRDFGANKDFEDHNVVSIWVKGVTGGKIKATFYNEAAMTNGYRFYASYGTGWTNTSIAKSSGDGSTYISNTVGTPTGWDKIRRVVIQQSGTGTKPNTYVDSFYIGQGWKLDAPGTRYDGIYAINTFEIDEDEHIRSIAYKMTLIDKTPFFGDA